MQESSHEENCGEGDYEEMISRVNKISMELKMKLEQLSKLRIDCVKQQLELLKLYKPRCLEILGMLREISTPGDTLGIAAGDNLGELLGNEGSEVLRANEDVSRKSTT